jgi:hypothetical protein
MKPSFFQEIGPLDPRDGLNLNSSQHGAYEMIFFAAQRIHLRRDDPLGVADLIIPNDPRLGAG